MTGLRRAPTHVAVAVVALMLGVLVVGQLRGQAGVPGLEGLTAQDLTVLVANLETRNEQLRTEVATLERQVAALLDARARGQSAVGQLRADLDRARIFAGLEAVVGPGIRITVSGAIGGDGIEDIVNELRNGGAEAIAIDGVRLVVGVVAAGPPGSLTVGGRPLPDSFEIVAVGSSQILTGTLTRLGGVVGQVATAYPSATVVVTPVERLRLPATDRDLAPSHGRPSL